MAKIRVAKGKSGAGAFTLEWRATYLPGHVRCAKCSSLLPRGVVVCSHCGRDEFEEDLEYAATAGRHKQQR